MSNGVINVVVGGVTVTGSGVVLRLLRGTISISQQINQSSSASFTLRDPTAGLNRPTVGAPVSISQDGVTLFVGFLQSFIEIEEQGLSSCQYQCTCVDWSAVTDRRVLTKAYTSGTVLQTVVQDIVNNFLTGDGVTLASDFDGTTVLPTTRQFNPSMVRDAFNQLCSDTNRQWWIDNNKQLHFQIPGIHYGAAPNPFNMVSNDGNWVDGSMQITRAADNYRNDQFITTPNQVGTVSQVDTFTTATPLDFFLVTTFALTAAPTVTVNGVGQTIYQLGVDPFGKAGWYWMANGYGVQQGQQIAPAPGSTVVVTYNTLGINYVEYKNAALVAARAAIEGTSGIWANIANMPQVYNSAEALAVATGMVTLAGVIPQEIQFQTYRQDAVLGCQINANIPERGINGWFTVTKISAQEVSGAEGVPSSNFTSRVGPSYGGVAKGILFTITMNDAQAIGPFPVFFQQLVASIGGAPPPNTAGSVQTYALATAAAAAAIANITQSIAETPSGTINGSNTAFTLSQTPNPAICLQLYLNGILQIQGTDYTISGNAITFTNAPSSGAWLFAFYRYGTPGPASFAYDETPGGAVNGSNVTFTLANTPSPSTSLQLYLNGVLQLQGTDYTIAGSTITFSNAPNTGDELIAYYGYGTAAASGNFADDETPGGTVNGSNTAFTLAHPPNPVTSLLLFVNGVLQLQGTDYTISAAAITFTNAPSTGAILTAFYRF